MGSKWGQISAASEKVGYFQQKKTLLQSHFQAKHKLGFLPRNKAEWGISLKSVVKMATEGNIYFITKTKLKIMHAPANKSQK